MLISNLVSIFAQCVQLVGCVVTHFESSLWLLYADTDSSWTSKEVSETK